MLLIYYELKRSSNADATSSIFFGDSLGADGVSSTSKGASSFFAVEDNGFWIGNDANASNTVRYRVRSGGENQFGPANLTRTSTTVKSAMSVKSSDFAITIDGNTPTTSISGTPLQVLGIQSPHPVQ